MPIDQHTATLYIRLWSTGYIDYLQRHLETPSKLAKVFWTGPWIFQLIYILTKIHSNMDIRSVHKWEWRKKFSLLDLSQNFVIPSKLLWVWDSGPENFTTAFDSTTFELGIEVYFFWAAWSIDCYQNVCELISKVLVTCYSKNSLASFAVDEVSSREHDCIDSESFLFSRFFLKWYLKSTNRM